MSVSRISKDSLNKILNGELKEPTTCVVKFYMNTCPMCKNLASYYHDIATDEKYSDLHFFAFNMQDNPLLEKELNFVGVPTISVIKVSGKDMIPRIRIMPEPDPPNDHTWYTSKDIQKFIEKER
tara:strand:+ start:114 stop:485 length:372 start_codon:yes stop_codon:yes gene_type:complete